MRHRDSETDSLASGTGLGRPPYKGVPNGKTHEVTALADQYIIIVPTTNATMSSRVANTNDVGILVCKT